jgi:hypothetical protein
MRWCWTIAICMCAWAGAQPCARAQPPSEEQPPSPPPLPPPLPPAQPPQTLSPAYPYPGPTYVYPAPYLPPPPSLQQVRGLELLGRHNLLAGTVLMASGTTLAVIGTGLLIAGASETDDNCNVRTVNGVHVAHSCGSHALEFAGATTSLIGAGALGIGIPVYIRGGNEVSRARALRNRFYGRPSIYPQISLTGAMAAVRGSF